MLNFCFTYQMFAFVLCENKLLNWIKWLKLQMNYERWLLWQYVAGFVLNSVSVVNPVILTPLPYIANISILYMSTFANPVSGKLFGFHFSTIHVSLPIWFFCYRSLNLSDWNRSVNKYSCRHACAVTMAESELVSFDFEIFGIVQGKESCVLWFYFVYFLLWTWRPDHQCTFRGHALVSCMVHPPYL